MDTTRANCRARTTVTAGFPLIACALALILLPSCAGLKGRDGKRRHTLRSSNGECRRRAAVAPRRISFVAIAALLALLALISTQATQAFAIEAQSDWVTRETAHFRVHAGKSANVAQIGRVAESIYTSMAERYNQPQTGRTDLYIYTDRSAFLQGSPSVNAAGYASPGRNTIAILQGVGNSTVTLAHEINHIIFMSGVPAIDTVPQWFIEGLAIHESQPGVEAARLGKYALARDIPDLIGRSGSSDGGAAMPKDYAQGYLMINFIVSKFGNTKLYEVIGSLQAGSDFNDAILQTLGRSQNQLNSEWRNYARGQLITIWLMQLQDIGWYLMSALIILAVIIVPIRKRKRLREMEEDEEEEVE